MEEPDKFSGIAYCATCGKKMTLYRAESMEKSQYHLKCSTYGKRGKDACSPHHILADVLEALVLNDLQLVVEYARTHEREFAQYINKKDSKAIQKEVNTLQREIAGMNRRNDELTALFKKLFEQNVLGRIPDDLYQKMSSDYNEERKQIEGTLPTKEAQLEKLKESTSNVEAFIAKAKKVTSIDELTPELLRLFIKRIEIGERAKKHSPKSRQQIRIIYQDIGEVDLAAIMGERSA